MYDSQIIKTLTYPAYCIKCLENGLVIISGGGGTSKTGVGNSIEIGRLDYDYNPSSYSHTITLSIIHNYTPNDAIMKFICLTHDNSVYLISAVGTSIEIYKMINSIEKCDGSEKKLMASASLCMEKRIDLGEKVEVTSLAAYDTNICVGTIQGNILLVDLLNGDIKRRIEKIHTKEIDDLQVDRFALNLLSVSKDNRSFVWSIAENFIKKIELNAKNLNAKVFRVRHGRFTSDSHLYTTHIPIVRTKNNLKCYIIKWNSTNFKQILSRTIQNTIITAFQANTSGTHLVYGDYEGRIVLIDGISLSSLAVFNKKHSSVITDLAFYHDSQAQHDHNKLVLSLSIDRTIQCYKYLQVNQRSIMMKYYFLFMCFLAFALLFSYFFIYLE